MSGSSQNAARSRRRSKGYLKIQEDLCGRWGLSKNAARSRLSHWGLSQNAAYSNFCCFQKPICQPDSGLVSNIYVITLGHGHYYYYL